jgi:hypothetical protein
MRLRRIAVTRLYFTLCVGLLAGSPVIADENKVKSDPEVEKLVQRLGSRTFSERETAARQLQVLGAKAKSQIIAGINDADAEVSQRCTAILKQIRADRYQALVSGQGGWDLEGIRFKKLVGDTIESRKLFAELINDSHRAEVVEKVTADPTVAASLYVSEVARIQAAGEKAFFGFMGQPVKVDSDSPVRIASRMAVPLGDVALLFFLGSFPLPDGAVDPAGVDQIVTASFIDACGGPLKGPFRKLFVKWLDCRRNPIAVGTGLYAALYGSVDEAVSVARRLAANQECEVSVIEPALLVLGNHGSVNDSTLLATYRDDARACEHSAENKFEIQIREVATAMSLMLRGQFFLVFGFETKTFRAWWIGPGPAPFRAVHWFTTPEERDGALKMSWEWLDKQPKPPGEQRPTK